MNRFCSLVLPSLLVLTAFQSLLPAEIIDLENTAFDWREISWNYWERVGSVDLGKERTLPFKIGMRFATRDSDDYLKKAGLERRQVFGISPGEITVITQLSAVIDGKEFVLPIAVFAKVVNPKVDTICIHFSEQHQFLITFNGPDASESYVCQFNVRTTGFVSGAIRNWVGGHGFGETIALPLK